MRQVNVRMGRSSRAHGSLQKRDKSPDIIAGHGVVLDPCVEAAQCRHDVGHYRLCKPPRGRAASLLARRCSRPCLSPPPPKGWPCIANCCKMLCWLESAACLTHARHINTRRCLWGATRSVFFHHSILVQRVSKQSIHAASRQSVKSPAPIKL